MSTDAVHLDRLLEPLADCLTVDVAAKVADLRADSETQSRIDYLAERANEGRLSDREREEYDGYLLSARHRRNRRIAGQGPSPSP